MRKMKIGIDIDEVITEFVKGYLKIYKNRYGRDAEYNKIFSFNLWEPLNISKEESIEIADEFYKSDLFENIEIAEGAVDAINKLGKEHEVFFITSRPVHIKNKTEDFIQKHFFQINPSLIFSGDFFKGEKTKAEICSELKLDLMIEDHERYSREIAGRGARVFLMSKPWNQDVKESENLVRVYNWQEILGRINAEEKE